jgi:hypothetical protein
MPRHEVVREWTGCASRRRILVDTDAGKEGPRMRKGRGLPCLEAEEIASLTAKGLGQRGELPGVDTDAGKIREAARWDEQVVCACRDDLGPQSFDLESVDIE